MNVRVGEVIRMISEHQGWFYGEKVETGEVGYFPPSYAKLIK